MDLVAEIEGPNPSATMGPLAPPNEQALQMASAQPPLEEMARMASQLDPSEILGNLTFNAMEALMVAYRKKPICYFEVMFEGENPDGNFLWSQEFDDWLVHTAGLNHFVDIYYPYDMNGQPVVYDTSSVEWGSKFFRRIVWYRPETRHHALLERHLWRLNMAGKDWQFPYHDIIRGLNYGYPEEQVREFALTPLLKAPDGRYYRARSQEELEQAEKVSDAEKEEIMEKAKRYMQFKYGGH